MSFLKIKLLIPALLLTWFGSALACDGPQNQRGENIDVLFARNSASLSVKELARLSAWSAEMRKFEYADVIQVVGLAETIEVMPRKLAEQRAQKVWSAMQQFGLQSSHLWVTGRVYTVREPRRFSEPGGQRVEITFGPGCPNNCCTR
ncbi:OmpA family protein [Caballeronia sp. ATUFL_F2_KS9A]|uniref:OmpA family protein n=1 Tax=Caballeronia sp. ATUFL_F2_KS9A TaxID=2921777 RepID=UPI0020278851